MNKNLKLLNHLASEFHHLESAYIKPQNIEKHFTPNIPAWCMKPPEILFDLQCVGCDAPFTVRHFLLECGDFAQVRNNCFHVDNMKELFQDIHIDSIMTFLRQINLFNKI